MCNSWYIFVGQLEISYEKNVFNFFPPIEQLREVCPWQRPIRGQNAGYLFSFALNKWSKIQLIHYACLQAYFYLGCFVLLCFGNFNFIFCALGTLILFYFYFFLFNNKIEILGQNINQSTVYEIFFFLSFNETVSRCLFSTLLSYQPPNQSQQVGMSKEQGWPVAISHFISSHNDLLFHQCE